MNNYLIERFGIDFNFQVPKDKRFIDEVNYDDLNRVMEELKVFTETPIDEIYNLRVFQIEDLLDFLKTIVEEWNN